MEPQDKIVLYNTLTREKDVFIPIAPRGALYLRPNRKITNFQHIGNFKTLHI